MRVVLLMVMSGVLTVSGFSRAGDYEALEPHMKKLVNAAFYQPCRKALASENGREILMVAMLLNDRESVLSASDKQLEYKEKAIKNACKVLPMASLYDVANQ